MAQEITNFARFYGVFNKIKCPGDREELKSSLVSSFTAGRTTHLREMTAREYRALCDALEARTGWKDALRKKRSLCLKLMQQAGVDTSDWGRINTFCQHPKIAGRVFARLGVEDLDALSVKLRAIIRKGGLGHPSPGPAGGILWHVRGEDGSDGNHGNCVN